MALRLRSDLQICDRIGIAPLVRAAMQGRDISSIHETLKARRNEPGAAMDLAVIEQISGNRALGLQIQDEALAQCQCYRISGAPAHPRMRVLALAAPLDIGGNTPIEFLVSGSDIELIVLYVLPGRPVEDLIPDHDIAIVTISDDEQTAECLAQLGSLAGRWPRPFLNLPDRIRQTDRDRLYLLLQDVKGLHINPTERVSRAELLALGSGSSPSDAMPFPLIARPVGSHAGKGLERLTQARDVEAYMENQDGAEFFLSPFTDYSNTDGLFRKYRIVFVNGRAFACHMAISDQWAIWYLNADMHASAEKRVEEERFMTHFDTEFGLRHQEALTELARRLALDYFVMDCAETQDGKLLVFEAGVSMIVHDMDPVELFPYKLPQMRKLFSAFTDMLDRHVADGVRQGAPDRV
ncbi:ATP-grasp domain-containing protein [Gluconacetobacter johannae]|uniref:ATP-grasp domain-containing protein n=1 Tax=Gluconacetobacter johannae TaxID=112140 RepID=UPI001C824A66|nr:hypothetical protein [Gluconacetobacter johannae]